MQGARAVCGRFLPTLEIEIWEVIGLGELTRGNGALAQETDHGRTPLEEDFGCVHYGVVIVGGW